MRVPGDARKEELLAPVLLPRPFLGVLRRVACAIGSRSKVRLVPILHDLGVLLLDLLTLGRHPAASAGEEEGSRENGQAKGHGAKDRPAREFLPH